MARRGQVMVIVTGPDSEAKAVYGPLQELLRRHNQGGVAIDDLTPDSDDADGWPYVYVIYVNHLIADEVRSHLGGIPWALPRFVEVRIKQEEDDLFQPLWTLRGSSQTPDRRGWVESDSGWYHHPVYGVLTYEPREMHGKEGWFWWDAARGGRRKPLGGPYGDLAEAKVAIEKAEGGGMCPES